MNTAAIGTNVLYMLVIAVIEASFKFDEKYFWFNVVTEGIRLEFA